MKRKRRVTTAKDARPGSPKRMPTVRRIKPAIGPAATGSHGRRPAGAPWPVRSATSAPAMAAEDESPPEVYLSVDLGRGLVLSNPIMAASGTFGYGVEHGAVVDLGRLGGICCRGTTLRPRIGNVPPRLAGAPGGMLNAIGLQNPGVDAIVERYAPTWANWRTPVIVNVAATSVADYVELARRLDGVPGVSGIELNLSCPNAAQGGLQFALDVEAAAAVTAGVRRATDLPLLVKLSPNVTDVRGIARAVEAAGADALSAINTLSGLALSASREGPLLGSGYGGLSGPAIRPVALRIVYELSQVVDIPVVAIGGVTKLADVLDFLAVGAVAVQVGTALFADPALAVRLVEELAAEAARRGLTSFRDLIGTALPRPKPAAPSARGVEYRP